MNKSNPECYGQYPKSWQGIAERCCLDCKQLDACFQNTPGMQIPVSTSETKPTNPKEIVGIRKLPRSVLPAVVVSEVALAMLEGACKYGRHNYRDSGVRASVYYDALNRHIDAWWEEGQDLDPDSNLHHITKAIACLMVLRDSMINDKFEDDRPPSVAPYIAKFNALAAELMDRHKDKTPRHFTIKDALDRAGLGDSHDALTFHAAR